MKIQLTEEEIKMYKLDANIDEKNSQRKIKNGRNTKQPNSNTKLNFVISSYYKGTGLEEVLKKMEQYLDTADPNESDITNI